MSTRAVSLQTRRKHMVAKMTQTLHVPDSEQLFATITDLVGGGSIEVSVDPDQPHSPSNPACQEMTPKSAAEEDRVFLKASLPASFRRMIWVRKGQRVLICPDPGMHGKSDWRVLHVLWKKQLEHLRKIELLPAGWEDQGAEDGPSLRRKRKQKKGKAKDGVGGKSSASVDQLEEEEEREGEGKEDLSSRGIIVQQYDFGDSSDEEDELFQNPNHRMRLRRLQEEVSRGWILPLLLFRGISFSFFFFFFHCLDCLLSVVSILDGFFPSGNDLGFGFLIRR